MKFLKEINANSWQNLEKLDFSDVSQKLKNVAKHLALSCSLYEVWKNYLLNKYGAEMPQEMGYKLVDRFAVITACGELFIHLNQHFQDSHHAQLLKSLAQEERFYCGEIGVLGLPEAGEILKVLGQIGALPEQSDLNRQIVD